MKAVGARLPRYDGIGHVTGRTRYVDDIAPDGLLHIAFVRSPHPRARILRIEGPAGVMTPRISSVTPTARKNRPMMKMKCSIMMIRARLRRFDG